MTDNSIMYVQAASKSCIPGYVVMTRFDRYGIEPGEHIYLGLEERYDGRGRYDNSDGSAMHVSDNGNMFRFLYASPGWVISQQGLLKEGIFTEADYTEYARILKELTSNFPDIQVKRFSVRPCSKGSGLPFRADTVKAA